MQSKDLACQCSRQTKSNFCQRATFGTIGKIWGYLHLDQTWFSRQFNLHVENGTWQPKRWVREWDWTSHEFEKAKELRVFNWNTSSAEPLKDSQVTHDQQRVSLTGDKPKYILDTTKPVMEFCKQGLKPKTLQIMLNSTSQILRNIPIAALIFINITTTSFNVSLRRCTSNGRWCVWTSLQFNSNTKGDAGPSNMNVIKHPKESKSKKNKSTKRRHDAKCADLTESDSNDQDSTSSDSEDEMNQSKLICM